MSSESPSHAGRLRAAAATRKVRLSLTRGNTFPQGDRPVNQVLEGRRLGSPEYPRPLGVPAEVPALRVLP